MATSKATHFTNSGRQALLAIKYGSGLSVHFAKCDTGEESASILPIDRDERFVRLDASSIIPTARGFVVTSEGGRNIGTFRGIRGAIATARRDLEARMAAHDPEARITGLLRWAIQMGALTENRAQAIRPGYCYVEH